MTVFKEARQASGQSQAQVAVRLSRRGVGRHQVTVSKIENGTLLDDLIRLIVNLADIVGVTPQALFDAYRAEEPPCERCGDAPPDGFICAVCGAES